MRIAVAGATGTVGTHIAAAVRARGDEVVPLTRGSGVDLVTGSGLSEALTGVDAVIDAVNISTLSADAATTFFTTATGNLAAAAYAAGVRHVVLLSIVGVDRNPHDYYAGKLAQERTLTAGGVPSTIVRATQFHEFAGQVAARAKFGPLQLAPRARTQPVAAAEVGTHLARIAAGDPQPMVELAGPREERLDDMVRRYARAHGARGWIPSVSLPTKQMKGMRAGLNLPGAGAVIGTQTFDEWLAADAAS
ncbi:SDR family oxidoreductase [Microbacterium sp. MC2]